MTEPEPLNIKLAEVKVFVNDAKYEFTICDDGSGYVMRNFQKFMVDYLREQAMNLDRS